MVWAVPDGGAGGGQDCTDMAGKALVLKVDTEANPQLSARFRVRGIPNFLFLSGGKTVVQRAGMVDYQQMEQWLRSAAE
jgi:thioredoxin 2